MIKGIMLIGSHHVEFQTWEGQGGEVEDLVAWCHTCDHQGENVMKVEMRDMSIGVAFTMLMTKVAVHTL